MRTGRLRSLRGQIPLLLEGELEILHLAPNFMEATISSRGSVNMSPVSDVTMDTPGGAVA